MLLRRGKSVEYLFALLTTLALHLPALTGQPLAEEASLPAVEVADNLAQAVFAHTGHHSGGGLTTAAYLPRENLILIAVELLEDVPELEAVLVHELVHWWQVKIRRTDPHGGPAWEDEARRYENLWRREHGLRVRPSSSPDRRRP